MSRLGAPARSLPARDRNASFSAATREHHDALVAFATRLSRDPDSARDLVQDTLERALRRFDALKPDSNVRAWLFTILHNAFIDRCRKDGGEPRGTPIDEVDIAAPDPAPPPAWTAVTAEQLGAAIGELEEEFRVVYRMHALDGRSYQEISAALDIPQNTVGTRLARARRKLRTILVRVAGDEVIQ